MSKIPPLTTLRVEDYPADQRTWLARFLLPVNQFLTAVTNTLNGRVEFGSNIPAITQQLSFVYDSSTQRIAWTLSNPPVILEVGQAFESGIAIAVQRVWSYDFSNKQISVTFLKSDGSALTVGNSYKIAIRIVP